MRPVIAIAWKDFRGLVISPMFMVIAGFFCALLSYIFMRQIFEFAARSMAGPGPMGGGGLNIHMTVFVSHISIVNLLFLFMVPILTMRALAEEKKMRTYDLLLTSPITATQITLGKYLSVYASALVLLALAFLYPLGTSLFADFHFGPVLTSFLGLALLTGVYVAIGMFASSVTSSIILAAFLGAVLILSFWFIGQGGGFSDSPMFLAIMEHLSVGQQFMSFVRGTIKLSAVIYMLSGITLFVFLTQRVVESSRWR